MNWTWIDAIHIENKELAQIRGEFYEQTELEGLYIDLRSWRGRRVILEAILGRQMWTNCEGPWIQL